MKICHSCPRESNLIFLKEYASKKKKILFIMSGEKMLLYMGGQPTLDNIYFQSNKV